MKSGISPSGRVYNSWCDPHASQCLISLAEYGNNLTHDTKLLPSGWRLCMVSKKVSWLFKIAENERWILCNPHHTQSLIFLSVSLPIPLPQMTLILRLEIKRKTSRTCNMGDNTDLFREQTLPWQPVVSGATVWCSRKETPRTWPSGSNSYSLCSCDSCKEAWCPHEGETRHHQLQWTQVASHVQTPGKGTGAWEESQVPSWPLCVTPAASASYRPPLSPHLSCHCVQLWHEMPPTQQGETIHQVPGAFHHLPLYLQTFHAQDFVGGKTEGNDPGGAVDVPGGANSHLRPLQNIDARRLRCAGGKVEVQNTQKGQLTETSKLEHLEETTNRPFLHCISQSPETWEIERCLFSSNTNENDNSS